MTKLFRHLDLSRLGPTFMLASGILSSYIFWRTRDSLWEDEIIAITHGLQPLPEFFVEVLRNDIHPFLYFLLLKFWTALDFGSDSWALGSSLFAVLLSIAAIWLVVRRLYDAQAALWAVALFSVLPASVAAAGNLRMYGIVPAIAVLCWFANREFLRSGRAVWAVILMFFLIVQVYIHAIGFYFAAFFALAALIEQWNNVDRTRIWHWLFLQTLSLAIMLPVVASALIRGTEPLPMLTLANLLYFPAALIMGQAVSFPYGVVFGAFTFLFLFVYSLLKDRTARILVLTIPCGGLITCMLISLIGKPMFKAPVFAAEMLPFLIIGAAGSISKVTSTPLKLFAVGYGLLLSICLLSWAPNHHVAENYRPAAEYVASHARFGDTVIVPHVSVYWGIMRYAVGARWGSPLGTMPLRSNEAWLSLKNKIGPRLFERLGLNPKTDFVDSNGIKYVIGADASAYLKNSNKVWVVHRSNYKEPVVLGKPMKTEEVTWFGDELSVSALVPDVTGGAILSNPKK